MADKEKVIASLGNALVQMHGCGRYTPEDVDELETAAWKALELLKEQEPVKPRYEDFFGNRIARCGNCNGYIVRYKYCPGCGKAVKWDD